MRIRWFILLFIPLVGLASIDANADTYSYLAHGKTISVPIDRVDGVQVNDVCLSAQTTCLALRMFNNPKPFSGRLKVETGASDYCRITGGTPLILTSPRQGKTLFCVFEDLSMVDARALESSYLNRKEKK